MKTTKLTASRITPVRPRELRQMTSMPIRPGALEMLGYPSRIGNTLFYPDGRVVKE